MNKKKQKNFIRLSRLAELHGLTVLIHPNTERPKDGHLLHAVWLGAVLLLDV